MSLGIVGYRYFNNYSYFKECLKNFKNIKRIVSGGANGTDTMAEIYAKEMNIPITFHKPEWDKYGKKAGPIRNKLIVEDSDVVIAFLHYKSIGTINTINICKRLNKKCIVVNI